ncbi:FkbM family methyltransferase [Massilia sp. G4R7]|uniref:FkbM family methyltransferase n=1 Tax=Massilia phyllostachyos TaxID=2898585 RepID=A0ABS8Q0L3_9BURK|nr:FkbM family methyltransferase [Massilia phyllostachyos]MCD2515286.1 FkbM family methyltransferase [Massilia phyllostachyos]
MKLISYAQNLEDVLLWRALGHVTNGFYIDVGANDPVEHSVTKAFYDAGWRGISIEPLPSFHAAFLEQRPRDVNLAIAAGAENGELTLYDVPAVRGWASPEQSVAELHRLDGHEVAEITVPVRTLASVCEEYVDSEIHFLKIDVEGFEGEVLRGMDFRRWRPWVLVIEATLPNSRALNHGAWEHLVTSQGYRYAWFDGLNRYYVAEEHAELLAHLDIQPNVFDDYIPSHLDHAWRQLDELREQAGKGWEQAAAMERQAIELDALHQGAARRAQELEQESAAAHARHEQAVQHLEALGAQLRQQLRESELHAQQLDLQAQSLTAQLHESAAWGKDLETRLVATLNSTSWRITAPLRFIARRGEHSPAAIARRKAKGAARRALKWLTTREALRRALLPLIMRSPRLQALVAQTLAAAKQATAPEGAAAGPAVPAALRELPQSARDALEQLRRAYEPTSE